MHYVIDHVETHRQPVMIVNNTRREKATISQQTQLAMPAADLNTLTKQSDLD